MRLISYDRTYATMDLNWGDNFKYTAYYRSGSREQFPPRDHKAERTNVSLELVYRNGKTLQIPLTLFSTEDRHITIPGSTPDKIQAYLINPNRLDGIDIKIMIYSADRERGREEFKKALFNSTLQSAARRTYYEVKSDGLRLRSSPNGDVLRMLKDGTYLKILEKAGSEWCKVKLPEGREGWVSSQHIQSIAR